MLCGFKKRKQGWASLRHRKAMASGMRLSHNWPEDQENPLNDIWHRIYQEHSFAVCVDGQPQRLGRYCPDATRPRPVRLKFGTLDGKHLFLKYAKVVRQAGLKADDDLTPLQQQERTLLEEDAETLRIKGYHPFFRGSQLHYCHNEKMHTCRKGKAGSVSSAGLWPEAEYKCRKL